jgi:signal transduction histidine kinase
MVYYATVCSLIVFAVQGLVLFLIYYFIHKNDQAKLNSLKNQKTIDILTMLNQLVRSFNFINTRNAAVFSLLNGTLLSTHSFVNILQLDQYNDNRFLEGFNYLPMIQGGAQLEYFNKFCTEQIDPNCALKQLNLGFNNSSPDEPGKFQYLSDTNRTYFPILYYYPVAVNNSVVRNIQGLDFTTAISGKPLLDNMLMNANSSSSIISGRVSLIAKDPNPYNNYGVYMTVPVKSQTDNRLLGFMNIIIRVSRLVNETIQSNGIKPSDLDVIVLDLGDNSIIYNVNTYSAFKTGDDISTDFYRKSIVYNLPFNNRSYRFIFKFTEKFHHQIFSNSVLVLIVVLTSSFLLVNLILMLLYRFARLYYRNSRDMLKQKHTQDMLSYCNHEFRNPLNIIKGLVSYQLYKLQTEIIIDRDELKHDLVIADSSCNFLEHIINDLITIQKINDNVIVIDNSVLNLKKLINDVLITMQQKSEEKSDLYVSVDCPDDLVICMDELRLKQILINLVSNSIKYTYEGHIIVSGLRGINDCVVISVADTGTGIPLTKQHLIFQKDIVIDSGDINRNGSHGIGLYLCKLLCDKMNIDISFKSSPSGTTFYLVVPQDV